MAWNKPLPHPTEISAPYWAGLQAHEVRLQQCEHGHWLFFPRTHCPTCGSRQLTWRQVSGAGQLYSFTVARVPTLPEFTDEMPQLLAVVELDEGVHINSTLVGVAPEQLQHIFEPFYTTDNKGTGLGLYISRELCESNQARLDYKHREGGGSCFRIIFAHPRKLS